MMVPNSWDMGMLSENESVLERLPFRDEPLEEVGAQTDCIVFTHEFSPLVDDDLSLFIEFVLESQLLDVQLEVLCEPNYVVSSRIIGTLKHMFSYSRVLSGFGGIDELNLNGLPYGYESQCDLDSAVCLFKAGHFKQCSQILRSSLEAIVTHAYYSVSNISYDDLPSRRSPPMNPPRVGMLSKLCTLGALSVDEKMFISRLYADLSLAVHSQEKYLTVDFSRSRENELVTNSLRHFRQVSIAGLCVVLNMDRLDIH